MNWRDKIYKPALTGLAILLLVAVSFAQHSLNGDRRAFGFTRVEPLTNAPPVLAFTTVALGGFRGLIANVLWMRHTQLQDEDKFSEMIQLADWITKLEPTYGEVWSMQAWNMAYNVSVKFSDPRERWLWVERGFRLLRDEGLKYNPTSFDVYSMLSWIFAHKMGQDLDDAQMYYKQAWFNEMQNLFGGNANFGRLLNPQTPEEKERVRRLTDFYKMDPKLMAKIDHDYGPLDWRLPYAHAAYWAEAGRERTTGGNQTNLRRAVYQALMRGFMQGRMTPSPADTNLFLLGPNFAGMTNLNKAYLDMIALEPDFRDSLRKGHKNFLAEAVPELYVNDQEAEAAYWFDYLKKMYPTAVTNGVSLAEFTKSWAVEQYTGADIRRITILVDGLLMQGYRRVASGFDNAGGLYLTWAAEAYDNYKKEADLKRVPIQPLTEMKLEVLQDLLGPDSRLSDLQKAYLSGRTGQPISARPVQLRPQPGAVMETNSPAVTNASAKTP